MLYFVATVVWVQAILLALSGFIKPQRGRWWQGIIFAGVLGIIGALNFFVARRAAVYAHRQSSRLCVKCGYDLRATPDRCPECGSVPEKVNG